jgi:hypothetical protein
MTILTRYVFSLIAKRPGITGREIRAQMKAAVAGEKVNQAITWLRDSAKIRVEAEPDKAARFYVAG